MVQTKKSASAASKSKASTSSASSATTSSTTTTSKVSSSSHQSSSKAETSGSKTAGGSSIVISEVTGSSNLAVTPSTYHVTPPELAHKAKEHYIFGGTQIVEVDSKLGSDFIQHERGGDGRTTTTTTTRGAIISEPAGSVETTTTTKTTSTTHGSDFLEQKSAETSSSFQKSSTSNGSAKTTTSAVTGTEKSSKKDDRKLTAGAKHKDTDNKFTFVKGQTAADSTDALLESERCIAKKAYITTRKTDDETAQSERNQASRTTKTSDKRAEPTHRGSPNWATHAQTHRNDNTNLDLKRTNLDVTNKTDGSDTFFSEKTSESFSTSSTVEKSSSSSQVIKIVDGKEVVTSETFNESGSMHNKNAAERLETRSGTGITPTVQYDQKLAEENIAFKGDNKDKEPIFDRNYMSTERNVKMLGNEKPTEHVHGTFETTHFDAALNKYVTDRRNVEDSKQIDISKVISDSSTLSKIDRSSDVTNTIDQYSIDNAFAGTSSINTNDINSTTLHSTNNAQLDNLFQSNNQVTDSTTTYTSKVFDDKTNQWKVVDESTVNEKNVLARNRQPTTTTNLSSTSFDRKVSDKKISEQTTEKISSAQHLYDEKSKTWREVDEQTIKSKRPSLIRYVSKDRDGKYTTIYKRKLFDKRSGTWKVVDEKVYRNNNFNEHIPEVIEDVTNITTTTYTTKVFDTKTNTWKVVDEKTFTDRETVVPKDIADEIARDQPDIANITTTTELTKVSALMLFCFHSFPDHFVVFFVSILPEHT